jgi:hypothetical protein
MIDTTEEVDVGVWPRGVSRWEAYQMIPLSERALEDQRRFLENRANFPLEEPARRAGRWVAWSPDGTRIVAEADDPEALDRLIVDAGEGPERCIREGIPAEDAFIG